MSDCKEGHLCPGPGESKGGRIKFYVFETGGFPPSNGSWGILVFASVDFCEISACSGKGIMVNTGAHHWALYPHVQDILGDQGAWCTLLEAETVLVTSLPLHGYNL